MHASQDTVSHILILRGGAIGDFILTLPAIGAIRRKWPDAQIELAINPSVGPLALAGGLADRVASLDNADFARLFADGAELPPDFAAHLRAFDLILSYLHDPDGVVQRHLGGVGARRPLFGSPMIAEGHAIDAFLKPLSELGIRPEPGESARLHLAGQRVEKGRRQMAEFGDRVVLMHPGSGSPKKNWPLDHFVEMAERMMSATNLVPVFVMGAAEEAMLSEFQGLSTAIPLLPPCSLVELAQCLSACAGYVGNDSGITHLAAALGIPVVALFGPTDPAMWAPRGPNVLLLKGTPLAGIAVADAYAAALQVITPLRIQVAPTPIQ